MYGTVTHIGLLGSFVRGPGPESILKEPEPMEKKNLKILTGPNHFLKLFVRLFKRCIRVLSR